MMEVQFVRIGGDKTIVDSVGEYIARNGARIVITELHPDFNNRGNANHFDAKGYYYPITPTKNGNPKRRRWTIWHVSGAYKAVGEHPRDIVKKV
jgi:hypothetical protein